MSNELEKMNMTHAERLAEFVARASFEDLSDTAVRELEIRILDSVGCAIGALGRKPVRLVREQIEEFGGEPLVTLIGGGKTTPRSCSSRLCDAASGAPRASGAASSPTRVRQRIGSPRSPAQRRT
jgi:hypothetical protein